MNASLDEPAQVAFRAHAGPQTRFLASRCYEILYGGQAGGGKSAAITVMPLRWVQLPRLYAVTFRRQYPDLVELIRESKRFYRCADPSARYIGSPFPHWIFGSGATVRYAHLQHEDDWQSWGGQQIHVLCFDELTTFLEPQYRNLLARVRSMDPDYPLRVRATTNPGGVGHAWVFKRWGPWLDLEFVVEGMPKRFGEDGQPLPPAAPGQVLWVVSKRDGTEEFFDHEVPLGLTRTFIPAALEDNPTLMKGDPLYAQRLLDNDPVRVKQLRDGNWLAKYGARLMFKREHFDVVDELPWYPLQVRAWDMAATEEKVDASSIKRRRAGGKGGPDYTVGLKYGTKGDGYFGVMDVRRKQLDPGGVWNLILETAKIDGKGTVIAIEQEPGSSGKFTAEAIRTALGNLGFAVLPRPSSADKTTRARPVSATAAAVGGSPHGRILVLRASWNIPFFDELEEFPDGLNDDQVDGLSLAHNVITTLPMPQAGILRLPPV